MFTEKAIKELEDFKAGKKVEAKKWKK
jgi:hypothetical protein